MTDKELKARQNRKKRKRRASTVSSVLAVLIVFLAFYTAISLFVAGLVVYSFYDTAENTEIYSINVLYDERKLYSIDAETANNEFGLYIPFDYLAEIGSFGLAGDGENVTLFIIGTENRIECTKNSSLIIINDNPLRISAPILYEDDQYLIPVMLLENYINGIDVTYDTEKMVCSVSSGVSKSDVTLKLLLPEDMDAAYFPDSYKYYTYEESSDEPTV